LAQTVCVENPHNLKKKVCFFVQMPAASTLFVQFSHVHIYCDPLREIQEYKALEKKLNAFDDAVSKTAKASGVDVAAGRATWLALGSNHGDPVVVPTEPDMYRSFGQDVVEQMLVGLGWRVTGSHKGSSSRSLIVNSSDPNGVKFVLTSHQTLRLNQLSADGLNELASKKAKAEVTSTDAFEHFDIANLERFAKCHSGRQGIAVLGFLVSTGGVNTIRAKYEELHPKLLILDSPRSYDGAQVLEVYAYYRGEKTNSDADPGTLLRFIEPTSETSLSSASSWVLPGMQKEEAVFDASGQPAYCDHWVSNVVSRTGFLDTLNDTLGFTPKVDFNAGIVAAGEAQIESTVTGNTSSLVTSDKQKVLTDQSQVYLPINNALSEVGHVHVFLQELGQGIQHIASRVKDLVALIQRANDLRKMTGAGLSFLQIPRSYYGYLTPAHLARDAGIEVSDAERCVASLRSKGIIDASDIVALTTTTEQVTAALPEGIPEEVTQHVLRARYRNLYALLREHVTEDTYLSIVRNNILVDIQGDDLLMQIFTAKVLQRSNNEESCFLEFIQRVCSCCNDPESGEPCKIKPGCGGFGIRNFLTLFLSIEVSKAAAARAEAEKAGNPRAAENAQKMVEAFTQQLDESNPILTAISDAMTAEGNALERGDTEAAKHWAEEKAKGNAALQSVSSKYKQIMRQLREHSGRVA